MLYTMIGFAIGSLTLLAVYIGTCGTVPVTESSGRSKFRYVHDLGLRLWRR